MNNLYRNSAHVRNEASRRLRNVFRVIIFVIPIGDTVALLLQWCLYTIIVFVDIFN